MKAVEILIVLAGVGLITLAAFIPRGTAIQGNVIVAGFMCFTAASVVHVIRK